MTLAAGLSVGGLPAFVGDLLISWRLPAVVDLPILRNESVRQCADGLHAAGLAQKLVIVRPYLMVVWAGAYSEAKRIVQELNIALPVNVSQLHGYDVAFEILNTCREDTEMVALFISEHAVRPYGVRTRGFELNNRRIYLLGSGAAEFYEYLEQHPEILPNQERGDGQVARGIMLRFAGQSFARQWVSQLGLDNAWGGGFEVAYPEKDKFKKIDNILFRSWLIGDNGEIHNSGRSFFSRYYGQDLYLSCFAPGEKTYIVPSLVSASVAPPDYEEIRPEWTVDTYVVKATGSFVDFARFQPRHKPVGDLMQLSNGALTGWVMDKGYVERCAKTAATVASQGRKMEIVRY